MTGNLTMPEDGWIGIGSGSERLTFDGTGNEIKIEGATTLGMRDGKFIVAYNAANTETIQMYKDNSYGYIHSVDSLIMNAVGTSAELRAQNNATSISVANNFLAKSKSTGGVYFDAGTAGFFFRDLSSNTRWSMDETNGNVTMRIVTGKLK